jgi:AraC-like DNA-binding protein
MLASAPLIATVLNPADRSRLDAAAEGRFHPVHNDTVQQAIRTVRERPVNAVLLAADRMDPRELPGVASLVRGFPGVPTVAVVYGSSPDATARLLDLGACGVRRMLDLGGRTGWLELRTLLADPTTPVGSTILARVLPELEGATLQCRAFFEAVVRLAPSTSSVRLLARHLGVSASTLTSKFFRARVPSPKRYLAAIRLLYAAALLAAPGLAIADVAYRLEFSSPQSFGRHLRNVLGITPADFRRRVGFGAALEDFVARLIVAHRPSLLALRPLDHGVADLGPRRDDRRKPDWARD